MEMERQKEKKEIKRAENNDPTEARSGDNVRMERWNEEIGQFYFSLMTDNQATHLPFTQYTLFHLLYVKCSFDIY